MKQLKNICRLLDKKYAELNIKGTQALLIDDKVYFPEYVFKTPQGRDMLQRAYLTYLEVDVDKYYRNIYNKLKESV